MKSHGEPEKEAVIKCLLITASDGKSYNTSLHNAGADY